MKKQKSILIALPLILAMLFVSLAPYAVVPAKAYDSVTETVYYFSDYYPTLDKATLEQEFPDYQVVYHHQWVTEATLFSAIMQGFPSGANVHTVIIDIKSFIPSGNTLNNIFSYFVSQGYHAVFVTPYDQAEYTPQDFISLLDLYYITGMDALNDAIDAYLDEVIPEMLDEEENELDVNHTIVLDGRLLETDGIGPQNIHERISNSPFMKRLIEALAAKGKITTTDYYEIIAALKNSFGIDILVHVESDDFISLYDYATPDSTSISALGDNVSVFAFWSLTDDMEAIIEQENGEYPVHVMEGDTITYSEDGLCVTVHSANGSGEEEELLAALRSILQ